MSIFILVIAIFLLAAHAHCSGMCCIKFLALPPLYVFVFLVHALFLFLLQPCALLGVIFAAEVVAVCTAEDVCSGMVMLVLSISE